MNLRDAIATVLLAAVLSGCDPRPDGGPPPIRLGDSVCAQCNMIISDERWATASLVQGPRGPEPRLFDDFNCQVNYELEHAELAVAERWAHDHATRQWLRTRDAVFLMSPNLRTPMGSGAAAFATRAAAEAAQSELTDDVVGFDAAWKRLGSAGAFGHSDDHHAEPAQEQYDETP